MAIADRNLTAGMKFTGKSHGTTFRAEAVEVPTGDNQVALRFKMTEPYVTDPSYKSLSSLGTAATGHACNGWVFWSIEGAETAAPVIEDGTSLADAPEATKPARRRRSRAAAAPGNADTGTEPSDESTGAEAVSEAYEPEPEPVEDDEVRELDPTYA